MLLVAFVMRRNVQDAIRRVRSEVEAAKRYSFKLSSGLELAELLADEVERLHKRLEEAERLSAPVARDAWQDEQVLLHVATRARMRLGMVDLENNPPRGLTGRPSTCDGAETG